MTDTAAAAGRLHALDAARSLALLLGVVLHASMSFFFLLPAQDVSRSTTLAVVFYVIHVFRMTLFFMLAGFLARLVIERRGVRHFVGDRAVRIGVPFAVGWLLLAPLTIAIYVWGLTRTFGAAGEGGLPGAQGFPLIHLWFLYYLAIFYLIALAARPLLASGGPLLPRIDAAVERLLRFRLTPPVLAVPVLAVLFLDPSWPVWFGIPTPDTGLIPKLPALVAFGTAFTFGWLLQRQSSPVEKLGGQWRFNLTLAAVFTVAALAIVGPVPDLATATVVPGGPPMRLVYAACYALATWFWTLGLVGATARFCSAPSPAIRYLADASYWIYLAHLPLVAALQVTMMRLPLHWSIKFTLIVTVTMALLLVSYRYLVRPTVIGAVLNGRRIPRQTASAGPVSAADRVPDLPGGGIAELRGVTKRYGNRVALDRLSLSVAPGELLALLGPNGAGKSTAIGLWLGTLEPDEGIVRVMGGPPQDVHSRLGVGVMMQEVSLAPMLTAREQLVLTASYYRDPLPVDEVIAMTGIPDTADRRYGRLSGGQKRQVQFAAAVIGRPKLLFLDEPTVGLDVRAREAMWQTIRHLRGLGCAMVLTTHYLEEAEALADRVTVLAGGREVATGSVEEMRALVASRRISCMSTLAVEQVLAWPGVSSAAREDGLLHLTATEAEVVVRRLLAEDRGLSRLEVRQASLAEAFSEITREAA